ncbi:MAG TPA: hypothetical protein VFY40_07600 [Blastocatellia bacterium]|nr:hypothetical protein [Blastocatellia bacterium]
MNSVDWTSHDDYGATLITGVTDGMRRHRQAFIMKSWAHIIKSWAHQLMNYARAHDRAPDQKAIAKILPDIPAN